MKLVEDADPDDAGAVPVCINCREDLDERGGIVFPSHGREGRLGMCAGCCEEAKELLT